MKKVLDIILTGLNYFFMVFAKIFQGIGWFFKTIGKAIAKFVCFCGKYVDVFVKKCILPVIKAIGRFFVFLWNKIRQFFSFLGRKIREGSAKFKQTKFSQKVGGFFKGIQNKLAQNIRYHHRKAIWGIIFILPTLIGFVYFFLFPFFTTIIYSFSNIYNAKPNAVTGESMGVITEFVGLENYKFIWNVHATFKETLGNVFLNTILDVLMILIFSLIIAVVLNSKFRGRSFVRAVFFMPVIFNSQAVNAAVSAGAVFTETVEESGTNIFTTMFNFKDFLLMANVPNKAVNFLVKTSDQIFNVISYSGIQILIFLSGIQSVPKHLYEAAKIEGATQYEIFWKITFPMVSPLMLTAGVYTVVDSFIRSDLLKLMKKYSLSGNIDIANGLGSLTNDGVYAAMSVLFFLVSLALVAIVFLVIKPMVFYYDE